MGVFRKIVHINADRRTPNEPFAGIKYDGSYRTAGQILSFIGVDRLNLERYPNIAKRLLAGEDVMDDLVEKLMDGNSNLFLPEVIGDDSDKIHSSRSRVIKVDSWLVADVDDSGFVEFVIMTNEEFSAHFQIFNY